MHGNNLKAFQVSHIHPNWNHLLTLFLSDQIVKDSQTSTSAVSNDELNHLRKELEECQTQFALVFNILFYFPFVITPHSYIMDFTEQGDP